MGGGRKAPKHKFYAVSRGRLVGIFYSWNFASKSVTGYPKAAYKAYSTLGQARAAMMEAGIPDPPVFEGEEAEILDTCSGSGSEAEQTRSSGLMEKDKQLGGKEDMSEEGYTEKEGRVENVGKENSNSENGAGSSCMEQTLVKKCRA